MKDFAAVSEDGSNAASMSPGLRARCELLRTLFAEATTSDVRARHRIGVVIADLKSAEHRYGASAVTKVAAELGRNEATLYRYAQVAEAWDEAALERLITARNPRGEALSWSHLVELSSVEDAKARNALTAATIAEGLSVRRVSARVHQEKRLAIERADGRARRRPLLQDVRRMTAAADVARARMRFDETLRMGIESATLETADELLLVLGQAARVQRALGEELARNAKALDAARANLAERTEAAVVNASSLNGRAGMAGNAAFREHRIPLLLAGARP